MCLAVVALLTTALFANGALDIAAARWFYRPGGADPWPLAHELPWRVLYRAASWITASLVVGALAALAASLTRAARTWRRPAVLVLLSLAIGPGLLGNALFKDHWQHPRPRDLVELGGALHYVPSPLIGTQGGASFPCGHCTVGFMYASGWWIWKRRRRAWARGSLVVGLALGVLLGVGRMAAGAHFLSDILWSALLALGVVHLLHRRVLGDGRAPLGAAVGVPVAAPVGAPADEQAAATRAASLWQRASGIGALVGGAAVLLALFVTPHGSQLEERVPLTPGSPRALEVRADTASVTLVLVDAPASMLAIDGELHGFGLPTSRLAAHLEMLSRPVPLLLYRIEARGWLTDVDAQVTLRVPAGAFDRVSAVVRHGDIRVSDLTRAQVVKSGAPQLQLRAERGHVARP